MCQQHGQIGKVDVAVRVHISQHRHLDLMAKHSPTVVRNTDGIQAGVLKYCVFDGICRLCGTWNFQPVVTPLILKLRPSCDHRQCERLVSADDARDWMSDYARALAVKCELSEKNIANGVCIAQHYIAPRGLERDKLSVACEHVT